MLIKEYFDLAQNNYLCNTSYPLSKSNWDMYNNNNYDLFVDESHLCFYIHIPFCKKLCSFCEYIKYPTKNIEDQRKYVDILKKDIRTDLINLYMK